MFDAGEGSSPAPSGHILVPENRNRRAASHWLVVFSRVGFRPLLIQAQPFPQPAQPASVGAIHTRPTTCCSRLARKGGAVTVERLMGRACPHPGQGET